mmetsp:Transcript_79524/g.124021  ORF Transcript_79524/g.124021 Transcript_79524/m.124021 type:complete len:201 (+) Transcript_79524:138-740(+)
MIASAKVSKLTSFSPACDPQLPQRGKGRGRYRSMIRSPRTHIKPVPSKSTITLLTHTIRHSYPRLVPNKEDLDAEALSVSYQLLKDPVAHRRPWDSQEKRVTRMQMKRNVVGKCSTRTHSARVAVKLLKLPSASGDCVIPLMLLLKMILWTEAARRYKERMFKSMLGRGHCLQKRILTTSTWRQCALVKLYSTIVCIRPT